MKCFVPYRIGNGPLLMDVPCDNGPYYYATRTIQIGGCPDPYTVYVYSERETGIERHWREVEASTTVQSASPLPASVSTTRNE